MVLLCDRQVRVDVTVRQHVASIASGSIVLRNGMLVDLTLWKHCRHIGIFAKANYFLAYLYMYIVLVADVA
jgi:hypothetical protein